MSLAYAIRGYGTIQTPSNRLSKVLKENKDKFEVSDDGFIMVNLENDMVRKAIKEQLDKLESLENKKPG
ncbi:hypothetical protein C2911_003830 [Escherichia coli]|nr:hypothetical protein [Escherichia coli]